MALVLSGFLSLAAILICLLGLLILSSGFSGSATAQKGDKEKKPTLPTYWTKLSLSAETKTMAYKIQGDYGPKIDKLKKEIKKLESAERVGAQRGARSGIRCSPI